MTEPIVASIAEKIAAAKQVRPAPDTKPIVPVRLSEMVADPVGQPLVKGFLEQGGLSVVYGEPSCGKTFLMLDLALHVAAGRPWFGRKVVQGPVVYVAAEAGRSIMRRCLAWKQRHGNDADIPFFAVMEPIDLWRGDGDAVRLLEVMHGIAPVLVVIDTLSRVLAGGNENAPDDMGALVKRIEALRAGLRCHVLVVHHSGKDVSKGSRGHSLLKGAVDTEVEVAGDDGVRSAVVTKQRDGADGGVVSFRLETVDLGRDEDDEPITSCVVAPAVQPISGHAKTALDALKALIDEFGRVCADGPLKGERVVGVEDWRARCKAGGKMGKDAKFRNNWKRAIAALQGASRVDIRGELAHIRNF